MTKVEKLLKKFLKNPSSLKYPQIENLLINNKFKKIKAKGSHIKFKHPNLQNDLIIPIHNSDCKDFYKHLTAKAIIQIS